MGLSVALLAVFFVARAHPAQGAGVVGTGTPASCTEAALDAALAGGGMVMFDCGADPVTMIITNVKEIGQDTAIDGAGLVTIDGNNEVQIFYVDDAATFVVENLTIANGNAGLGHNGGGIFNAGSLTVTNSTLSGNSGGGGGAIANSGGTLTVTNSAFSDNIAAGLIGGGLGGGVGNFDGTLTVTNSTFSDNFGVVGGGIGNSDGTLTVTNSVFSGNFASGGGGIGNPGGRVTITNSTFSGNSAGSSGGGGGGIANYGEMTVTNSTFSDNNGGYSGGGGVFNGGGTLTVTNSTFSGNSAPDAAVFTGAGGGGIFNQGDSTLTVTNCTFSGNSAPTYVTPSGGGIRNFGMLTVTNSIIANSTNGDCVNNSPLSGTVTDGGHNLVGEADNACGLTDGVNGNLVGVDPLLDPAGLQDNGGPSETIALLPGSPAIDAGGTEVCANPPVNGLDQRGYARLGVGYVNCSIGAYEYNSPGPAPVKVVGSGTPDSCTEAALDTALAGGGTVTFDCGAEPATITITSTKAISSETAVDGGGLVTLDGNRAVGVLLVAEQTTLSVENLTIANGYAADGGGIINVGTLTVTNSTFSENSAGNFGGGILNTGTLAVTNCTFSGNAGGNGGALPGLAQVPGGGGIYNGGRLTVTNSTFSENGAVVAGGIWNDGTLAVTNSTFSENGAVVAGGIYNGGRLTVTNSTFSENSADNLSGGIGNAGTLTVTNSTFSGNSSGSGGGAIGGGGTVTVSNSTFSDNSADDGGAIANYSNGTLTVTNSTFSGNDADEGGGAISGGGTVTVTNCTFSANNTVPGSFPYGGGIFIYDGTLMISNTIIADSSDGSDCVIQSGTVSDGGHNLIEDAENACGLTNGENGNLIGVNPMLDPAGLADNGGQTQTIALLPGSPAIDGGDPAVCASPPVNGRDQRGYVRPGVGHTVCSIGAYEADAIPVSACVGDCDGDAMVAVDELILGVDIALGEQPVGACPAFRNSDGMVDIAQVIKGVNNALDGCAAG